MSNKTLIPQVSEVDSVLDEIRPHLVTDGGDIKVVNVTDEFDIMVEFLGNCQSCTLSGMTLANGVEHVLRSRFPDLRNVIAVKSDKAKIDG